MQGETLIRFIRHGQSEYNGRAERLRQKLNIGATWQQYKSNPQFMQFKYSQDIMDCSLSLKGMKQCQELCEKVGAQEYDLILVSPLYRTLQTCAIIFKNEKKTKIIVDPILAQSLRCTCDVSYNLFKAKEEFPHFDFSLLDGKQSKWYIQNQQPEKQQIYEKYLLQNGAISYEERAKYMNKYMKQTYNFQGGDDLIKRSRKVRERLRQYAQTHKAKKIAVVSHYYTISYTMSEQFNEKHKPVPAIFVNNAQPIDFIL